jgi:LCP family protein required for cell wall assembly
MKRLEKNAPAAAPGTEPRHPRRRWRTPVDHFGTVSMILLLACSLVLFARLLATDLLAGKTVLLLILALLAVNAASVIVQIPLRRDKTGKLICGAAALLLSGVMLWGMSGVSSAQEMLNRITGRLVETDVIAVIVTADDPAEDLTGTLDYTFGYAEKLDAANTALLVAELDKAMEGGVKTRSYGTMTELVDALYDDEVDAIILNKGYIALLQDKTEYADFSKQTRIIFEHTITREIDMPDISADVDKPFVIYCSGIDARDTDLSVKSRSDTNILAVVNPTTRQILLINTPRDYYVPLHMNGEMDKLTHAGLYGIDESMKTLDDLYGITTSYYVRVNFNGLVDIVDALGGIDVESPMEFTTNVMEIPDDSGTDFIQRSYYFPEGKLHISGREALAFSRERYAFSDGDLQRGRNQMEVISGIVDRATSTAVLSNLQGFLKAVQNAFITNLSYSDMSKLAKQYQKAGGDWNITTYSVGMGDGDTTQYTYTYGWAWVMWPDYDTVDIAKELIRQVMDGEIPTPPETEEDY